MRFDVFLFIIFSFDYLHKKQTGGAGQFGRVIGRIEASTAQKLTFHFEWSYFAITSANSKVRTTLYSVINSTTGEYCSVALNGLNSHTFGFNPQTQKLQLPCAA